MRLTPRERNEAIAEYRKQYGDDLVFYRDMETPPSYKGAADLSTLRQRIRNRLDNTGGINPGSTVWVSFIVDRQGKVRDARVIKGNNEKMNKTVLKVVSGSGKWDPGKIDGQPVDVVVTYGYSTVEGGS